MRTSARVVCFLGLALLLTGCGPRRPVVAIVRGDDPDAMVAKAIDLLGGLDRIVQKGAKVVIKPNLCSYRRDRGFVGGMTTDVRVVAGLVKYIEKNCPPCRLTIAEGSGMPTMRAYDVYGYTELAKAHNISLVDLNNDKGVMVPFAGGAFTTYDMPKTMQDCDVMINVPVLKTHWLTGITVGMKNLYGLLARVRTTMHEEADEVLSDVSRIRPSNLIIVDGLCGMEGRGPADGSSVWMNVIIAGTDVVAVDAVAAAVMGFDPNTVQHLKIAHARGLGECDLSRITIKGEPIEKVARRFKTSVPYPYQHPLTPQAERKIRSVSPEMKFSSDVLNLDPNEYPFTCIRPFKVWGVRNGAIGIDLGEITAFQRHIAVAEIRKWLAEPAESTTRPATEPAGMPAGEPSTAPTTTSVTGSTTRP